MLYNLIHRNRSYRRFYEDIKIDAAQIRQWIDLARLSASGRNAQPLKYMISTLDENNQKIFETLSWAASLKNWSGPPEGERPSAYIIQLLDTNIANKYYSDDGIATQSILLGAVEDGFGGCILQSIKKTQLRESLKISDQYEIISVIALGKPKEKIEITEMKDGDFQYWRDENGVHHVPKRSLDELIIKIDP